MKHPEKGDKLWLVHDGYPLIIRVTVLGTDQYGDFEVDEPTGNTVSAECLFADIAAAAERLLSNVAEATELWQEAYLVGYACDEEFTLERYRSSQRSWVAGLEKELGRDPNGYGGVLSTVWPDKSRGSWLTMRQIRELKGMPLNDFAELYK
jgi:hypothetical protein